MNFIEVLLMIIVLCLAPVLIIPALTLLVLWLLIRASVQLFQVALALVGIAMTKCSVYWRNRQENQTEEIKQIEEAKS